MKKWIDIGNFNADLSIGYLVQTIDNNHRGAESFALRERPLRTNRSNEARLTGWCGETDNRSRTAMGAWRIARLNAAQDRAEIVRLEGSDLAAFLKRDGYPELIPRAAA